MQSRRNLPNLVEEHSAAIGGLEQTALLLARIGEGAALVAEQLALQQLLRQRRRRDVDERLRRALAVVMDGLGGEVLPGARLAGQQHGRGRARRDAGEQRLDLHHRRRCPDDRLEAVLAALAAAQVAHFAAKPARLEPLLHHERHFVEVERLVDVVIRAEAHGFDRVLHARIRRHQDDERFGRQLLDTPQHIQAVAVRQPQIQQDQVDLRRDLRDGRGRGRCFRNGVAVVSEPLTQRPPNQILVIHDEKVCGTHWYRCLFGEFSAVGAKDPPLEPRKSLSYR